MISQVKDCYLSESVDVKEIYQNNMQKSDSTCFAKLFQVSMNSCTQEILSGMPIDISSETTEHEFVALLEDSTKLYNGLSVYLQQQTEPVLSEQSSLSVNSDEKSTLIESFGSADTKELSIENDSASSAGKSANLHIPAVYNMRMESLKGASVTQIQRTETIKERADPGFSEITTWKLKESYSADSGILQMRAEREQVKIDAQERYFDQSLEEYKRELTSEIRDNWQIREKYQVETKPEVSKEVGLKLSYTEIADIFDLREVFTKFAEVAEADIAEQNMLNATHMVALDNETAVESDFKLISQTASANTEDIPEKNSFSTKADNQSGTANERQEMSELFFRGLLTQSDVNIDFAAKPITFGEGKAAVSDTITQIAERIIVMTAEGYSEMEVQVTPENIGKLLLRVVNENGQFSAYIATESNNARELIQSHLSELKAVLKDQGYDFFRFDVNLSNGHNQQQQRTWGDAYNWHDTISKSSSANQERFKGKSADRPINMGLSTYIDCFV